MTIRTAMRADYAQVAALYREMHRLHQSSRPDIFSDTDTPVSETLFGEMCENPDGILLAAEEDGQLAGFAYTQIKKIEGNAVVAPRTVAHMDDLAVFPAFEGCGVGRALVEETKRLAAARGASSLELMVWEFNENAREFYEHLGMTTRSRIMEAPLTEG